LEKVHPPERSEAVGIVDVREVPLKALGADGHAKQQVNSVLERQKEPSLVFVANFNSAI
jgi:hypothetical protein